MKIKQRRYGQTRSEMQDKYDRKQKLSRTRVGAVKGVRLGRDMVLYPDGVGGLKVRLYSTDIVHYSADGYIGLSCGGWFTPTTFARIAEVSGVNIFSCAGQKYVTDAETRVGMCETREGGASSWIRGSIPFVNGMRYNAITLEIHPDDLAKIPTEKRRMHTKPTKATDAAFKKVFAVISQRVRLSLNLGTWADIMMKGYDGSTSYIMIGTYGYNTSRAEMFIDDIKEGEELTDDRLYQEYMNTGHPTRLYRPTSEGIQQELKAKFATFRKNLKDVFVGVHGATEQCGGEVLGNGYWVNPKEVNDGNNN